MGLKVRQPYRGKQNHAAQRARGGRDHDQHRPGDMSFLDRS
jgi:hypothetical protein